MTSLADKLHRLAYLPPGPTATRLRAEIEEQQNREIVAAWRDNPDHLSALLHHEAIIDADRIAAEKKAARKLRPVT